MMPLLRSWDFLLAGNYKYAAPPVLAEFRVVRIFRGFSFVFIREIRVYPPALRSGAARNNFKKFVGFGVGRPCKG